MNSNDIRGKKVNALFSEDYKVAPQTETLGIISLIIGVFGLLFSFCCTFMAVLPGLIAAVCGVISNNNGQKYGLAGMILGFLTVIAAIVLTYLGMR